jgi:hypothetical protein
VVLGKYSIFYSASLYTQTALADSGYSIRLVRMSPKHRNTSQWTIVRLTVAGIRQRRDVLSGGSFGSSNDPRPHFGLGASTSVKSVEVQWPDSSIQKPDFLAGVDRFYTLEEGKQPVPGL